VIYITYEKIKILIPFSLILILIFSSFDSLADWEECQTFDSEGYTAQWKEAQNYKGYTTTNNWQVAQTYDGNVTIEDWEIAQTFEGNVSCQTPINYWRYTQWIENNYWEIHNRSTYYAIYTFDPNDYLEIEYQGQSSYAYTESWGEFVYDDTIPFALLEYPIDTNNFDFTIEFKPYNNAGSYPFWMGFLSKDLDNMSNMNDANMSYLIWKFSYSASYNMNLTLRFKDYDHDEVILFYSVKSHGEWSNSLKVVRVKYNYYITPSELWVGLGIKNDYNSYTWSIWEEITNASIKSGIPDLFHNNFYVMKPKLTFYSNPWDTRVYLYAMQNGFPDYELAQIFASDINTGWSEMQIFNANISTDLTHVQTWDSNIDTKDIYTVEWNIIALIWLIILYLPAIILSMYLGKIGFIFGISLMGIVLYLGGLIPLWITIIIIIGVGILLYRRDEG